MQQHNAVGSSIFFSGCRAEIQKMKLLAHCHHGPNTPCHIKCEYNLALKGCVSVSVCFLRTEFSTTGKNQCEQNAATQRSCFASSMFLLWEAGVPQGGCTLAVCRVLACWCPPRPHPDSRLGRGTIHRNKNKVCRQGCHQGTLMGSSVQMRGASGWTRWVAPRYHWIHLCTIDHWSPGYIIHLPLLPLDWKSFRGDLLRPKKMYVDSGRGNAE